MDNLVQIFSSGTTSAGVWALMFAASFLGGVLASISPCSLAMLPLIIGYVGGYSKETPLRTFVQLSFFIFGTAIVFSIIGMVLTFIVMPLINHFSKAKANDGKIDANEVKQGLEILADGSEKVAEEIKQRKDK